MTNRLTSKSAYRSDCRASCPVVAQRMSIARQILSSLSLAFLYCFSLDAVAQEQGPVIAYIQSISGDPADFAIQRDSGTAIAVRNRTVLHEGDQIEIKKAGSTVVVKFTDQSIETFGPDPGWFGPFTERGSETTVLGNLMNSVSSAVSDFRSRGVATVAANTRGDGEVHLGAIFVEEQLHLVAGRRSLFIEWYADTEPYDLRITKLDDNSGVLNVEGIEALRFWTDPIDLASGDYEVQIVGAKSHSSFGFRVASPKYLPETMELPGVPKIVGKYLNAYVLAASDDNVWAYEAYQRLATIAGQGYPPAGLLMADIENGNHKYWTLPPDLSEEKTFIEDCRSSLQNDAADPRAADAELLDQQVEKLYRQGEYAAALGIAERSLELRNKSVGPEHPSTAESLNNLGALYEVLGDYPAAKGYYVRALKIKERVLGRKNPSTALGLNNLGALFERMGDYAAAKSYYAQALAIFQSVCGPNHPDTATSLSGMGGAHRSLGEYATAMPYYERALAIVQSVLGPEDPDTARSLNDLGVLHEAMNNYAEALTYFERALAIKETNPGPMHPDTATSLSNLGGLYKSLGDYETARSYYERALAIRERTLGPVHPKTATSVNNLGAAYESLGDYAAARPYYDRSLAIFENVVGPEHPATATSLNNMGALYHEIGDDAEAIRYFERGLAIYEKALGPEHPDTAASLNNLGFTHAGAGEFERATAYFERALGMLEPDVMLAAVESNYSILLGKAGRYSEAIFFGKHAVNRLQRTRARMVSLQDGLQQSFLTSKNFYYQHLASLLIDRGRLPEAGQVLDMLKEQEYFDFIRRDAESGVRSTTAAYTSAEMSLSKRYADLRKTLVTSGLRLAELRKRSTNDAMDESESEEFERLKVDLRDGRRGFNTFVNGLKAEFAEQGRAVVFGEKERSQLERQQNLLKEIEESGHRAVLVHYLVLTDKVQILLTTSQTMINYQSKIGRAHV